MTVIYVDHNVLSQAVGALPGTPAAAFRVELQQLAAAGVRFALSAAHIFEVAGSNRVLFRVEYALLVEQLHPLYLSNPLYVKRAEIEHFVRSLRQGAGGLNFDHRRVVFNETIAGMWATYGGALLINEGFLAAVDQMLEHGNRNPILAAVAQTAAAIRAGRDARAAGMLRGLQTLVDQQYFASHMPVGISIVDRNHILQHIPEVTGACPTIKVEDLLTTVRVNDSFAPEPGDAMDLQHAMSALPYCEGFLTFDIQLREHSRQVLEQYRRPCLLYRRISDIPPP